MSLLAPAWRTLFPRIDVGSRLQRFSSLLFSLADRAGELASDLVVRARTGDKPAFDRLARNHHEWLVRYLLFMLGNQGDAEDVAQDTLLRSWLAIGELRDSNGFQAWIRQIATHQAYNHRRGQQTRARYTDAAPKRTRTPSGEAAFEARDLVESVLMKLPYPYREALVLRHVECLSVSEIATMLSIGESAAKMRLKRARESFEEVHGRTMSEVSNG
ncbi:MAG: RNA polymerase sigma-70 factor (ECF subfamily) [Myxococcota bacterium]